MMRVDQWLSCHEEDLGSEFERMFVERVLGKMQDVDFRNVKCQYSFRDADGRQRYCDFVLQEGQWVKIAFEADGYDKRGTGQGMSKADFVDWQRRQAALTSQGWSVLRFANTDIRDYPDRCRHHIELLLREKRAQEQHQAYLRDAVKQLEKELDKHSNLSAETIEAKQELERRLQEMEQRLEVALEARPLTPTESHELDELTSAQNTITVLKGENSTMKTTIWAFTIIIVAGLIAAVFAFGSYGARTKAESATVLRPSFPAPGVEQSRQPAAAAGQSSSVGGGPQRREVHIAWCSPTADWYEATYHIGSRITIEGPVKRVSRPQHVNGDPTFITVGVDDPMYDELTLVVWGADREKFGSTLDQLLVGWRACATGKVRRYRGHPEIVLRSADQLSVKSRGADQGL